MILVDGETLFAASSAARIMAAPPWAWTFRIETPNAAAARRTRHRVGNVVVFQVQKDREPHVEKGPHAVRAMGVEEFQAQLQAAD